MKKPRSRGTSANATLKEPQEIQPSVDGRPESEEKGGAANSAAKDIKNRLMKKDLHTVKKGPGGRSGPLPSLEHPASQDPAPHFFLRRITHFGDASKGRRALQYSLTGARK
jgi:hypothetical protein